MPLVFVLPRESCCTDLLGREDLVGPRLCANQTNASFLETRWSAAGANVYR
jgi:hypothetical protein